MQQPPLLEEQVVVASAAIEIGNICNGDDTGFFFGNAENMGWRRDDDQKRIEHPTTALRKAEWTQGRLKVLCEPEGGEAGIKALDLRGFADRDFGAVRRYFEQNCNVRVRKRRLSLALDSKEFDGAIRCLEEAADCVDEAIVGTPLKNVRELELLSQLEVVRDDLEEALSGERQALNNFFSSNNCERLGRLRLILDTVRLEVYDKDPRRVHLRNSCTIVESVLKDLGSFKQWRPPEDREHASMLRRSMLHSLKDPRGHAARRESAEVPPPGLPEESAVATQPPCQEAPGTGPVPPGAAGLPNEEAQAPETATAPGPLLALEPSREASDDECIGDPTGTFTRGDCEDFLTDEEAEDCEDPLTDEEVEDPNLVMADPYANRRGTRQPSHPGSILEGWLWKRSRFLRHWRRRWVVLMPQALQSFQRRGDARPTESIAAGAVLWVYSSDCEVSQTRSFAVTSHKRTYFFICDTQAQKQTWLEAVNTALAYP